MQRADFGEEAAAAIVNALSASPADVTHDDLPDADRAMLTYARKLTETPAAVQAEDVQSLRAVGFDDLAIHDICCVTSYFAFVNRIADGLGVELEPDTS